MALPVVWNKDKIELLHSILAKIWCMYIFSAVTSTTFFVIYSHKEHDPWFCPSNILKTLRSVLGLCILLGIKINLLSLWHFNEKFDLRKEEVEGRLFYLNFTFLLLSFECLHSSGRNHSEASVDLSASQFFLRKGFFLWTLTTKFFSVEFYCIDR